MKNRFPIVLVCLLFCLTAVAVHAQLPYKVEGKNVIVAAAEAGDACAVNYTPGLSVKVKTIPGGGASDIRTCDTNALLGTAAANGGSTVLVPRDATTGYFCFKASNPSFDVTLLDGGGADVISYRWLATPPDPDSGISYPYSRANFNVRDFGAKGDGATEDTEAIRSALAFAASRSGGTVFFPSGDYVIGPSSAKTFPGLTLPGGVVIQGVTSMPQNSINSYTPGNIASAPGQYSRIRIRNSNQRIFRIGECTTDVKIKNMTLRADPVSGKQDARPNTVGVEAIGKTTPSMVVGFTDVSFETLDIGFDARDIRYPTEAPIWQFDFVKVDHCYFIYNKTAGIRVATYDTDWKITNSFFLMPRIEYGEADGIQLKYAGAMLISQTFGGGLGYAANQKGGDFLDIITVGALTVLNSSSERASSSMIYAVPGSGARHAMIAFINNIFGDKINLNSTAAFFSSGNLYGGRTFEGATLGSDGIHPSVQITSVGDRFCYDSISGYAPSETPPRYPCGESGLTSGGFKGGKLVFQSGQTKDVNPSTPTVFVDERPAVFGTDVQMDGRASPDASKAVLSVLADYQKILLEIGDKTTSATYVYRLKRGSNGWLEFTGTQGAPYQGYTFDAPVRLQTYAFVNLPTGTPTTGTMVYCTDCARNSSPCSSPGPGTLAILNGSAWQCH